MTSTDRDKISVMMLIIPFHPAPMGGAELQAVKLAKKLIADGNDVFIVTIAMEGEKNEGTYDGIKVFRVKQLFDTSSLKSSAPPKKTVKIEYEKNRKENFTVQTKKSALALPNYFVFFFRVLQLVRSKHLRVDIIYSPIVEWVAYIATLLASRMKVKAYIKDSTMNGVANILRYPLGKSMHSTIVTKGNFIAMTRAIRHNFLAAGIAEDRIFMIPNGVALPAPRNRDNVDRSKFIFVGNLYQQPAKGIDILLKAWKTVLLQRPQVRLDIVGDGATPEYHDYVKAIGIQSGVAFLGKRKDIPDLLSHSYAFILPSRREGMSNALLEAMSLGVPCIATDISGSQDLIIHNQNGMLVPVEDEDALAAAIIQLYDNPSAADKMGVEARKTIEQGYTQEIVSAKYVKAFTQ
jgi:glycosyltransferase involved in cell wall biosynthesis